MSSVQRHAQSYIGSKIEDRAKKSFPLHFKRKSRDIVFFLNLRLSPDLLGIPKAFGIQSGWTRAM